MKSKKLVLSSIIVSIFLVTLFQAHAQAREVSLPLTQRQLCDLELIMNGGFSPIAGFMNLKDYASVVEEMRLADGTVWPMPIVLDVSEECASTLSKGSVITLKALDGTPLAKLTVDDIYKPDKFKEAAYVYGTQSPEHFGVKYLFDQTKDYYVGGSIEPLCLPKHYDFTDLRKTPQELKEYFKQKGYTKVVAFQTRNPMHRAHQELTLRAGKETDAHILIHPVVGSTKSGDIDYVTRVKCYKKILKRYPENAATLSLLPLSMRMAGPREALLHAIIRKNYGCTHFIVGRDHAGPGKDNVGNDFYDPYEAQYIVAKYADEIGITMIPFKEMVYVKDENVYKPIDEVSEGTEILSISGTQLRALLKLGLPLPDWFTYPEVAQQLQIAYPPAYKKGFTIFLTGLSGAGKTTIAEALAARLMELQERRITLLDGDIIRHYLSNKLGFSKEDRSINVRRIGFVAQEITKHGGIAICSLIAPYQEDRQHNREYISSSGGYIELYVATPLGVCEQRDPKGLYAQAREGIITNFTGIDDPYEIPQNPELVIDTTHISIGQAVEMIVEYLKKEHFILHSKNLIEI